MTKAVIVLGLLSILIMNESSQALPAMVTSTRERSTYSGGVAEIEPGATFTTNPALLSGVGSYQVGVDHGFLPGGARRLSLSAIDGSSGALKAQFGYAMDMATAEEKPKGREFQGALGYAFNKKIALGISGSQSSGPSMPFTNGGLKFDAGAAAWLNSWLSLGVVGANLYSQHAVNRGVIPGLGFLVPGNMKITANVPYIVRPTDETTKKLGWNVGSEIQPIDAVFLRAGYGLDPFFDKKGYALGGGWIAPRVRLQYSFSHGTDGTNHWASATLVL